MHKPVERLKSEVTVEGGVGKTIVGRTLLDYFRGQQGSGARVRYRGDLCNV